MRSVKSALNQSNAEQERKNQEQAEREERERKHTGPAADQRVDYVRDLIKTSED